MLWIAASSRPSPNIRGRASLAASSSAAPTLSVRFPLSRRMISAYPSTTSSRQSRLPSGKEFPENYWSGSGGVRDVFVCTHNHDVCCGKFGDPLYKELRRSCAGGDLRVWRASHIGESQTPLRLDLDGLPGQDVVVASRAREAASLVRRGAPFPDSRRNYRGWPGLGSRFEQIAEREMLARVGWKWTDFPRRGELHAAPDVQSLAREDTRISTG